MSRTKVFSESQLRNTNVDHTAERFRLESRTRALPLFVVRRQGVRVARGVQCRCQNPQRNRNEHNGSSSMKRMRFQEFHTHLFNVWARVSKDVLCYMSSQEDS